MKQRPELPQGTLDLLVLKALSHSAMHGYGIGQRIQQLSDAMLTIEEGTLYPALYRMERRGWIRSVWGTSENNRRARIYSLTPAGHRQLDIAVSRWENLTIAVGKILNAT